MPEFIIQSRPVIASDMSAAASGRSFSAIAHTPNVAKNFITWLLCDDSSRNATGPSCPIQR